MKTQTALFTIGLLLCTLNSSRAGIAGHWEAELTGDGDQPVRVTLDLDRNAESEWIASMGLPEMNMTGLVVQDVTVEENTVKFTAVELMMTPFELTLSPDGTLKGTTAGRAPQPVEFRRTGEAKVELIKASPAVSAALEGVWEGMLKIPNGGGVPLTFKFRNQPDNTVKAAMSTDRDKNLPLNDVRQAGRKVEFGMKIAHARFEGTLNEEGTELTGQLIHGEGEGEHISPLTLRKPGSATGSTTNENGEKTYAKIYCKSEFGRLRKGVPCFSEWKKVEFTTVPEFYKGKKTSLYTTFDTFDPLNFKVKKAGIVTFLISERFPGCSIEELKADGWMVIDKVGVIHIFNQTKHDLIILEKELPVGKYTFEKEKGFGIRLIDMY